MDERPSYRRRIAQLIRTHPRISWAAGISLVALMVFVLVWFQPQKLFIEETVTEALPASGSEGSDPGTGPEREAAEETTVLASGSFRALEHPTTGTAKVIELADGRRFLRLEGLDTSNGPDLRVYLSEVPVSDDWYAYGERFVDLGGLKGNRGDQNYLIPTDLDLSRFESAVIWCRRFTVGFGVAGLDRA